MSSKKIFINNYGFNDSWIMGKISSDIQREASALGYECNRGTFDDYRGEEICYHLAYHIAVPIPSAKHNSVFYTHLNDRLQEKNLVSLKDKFDSFICMSPEDAQYLIELGFDPKKVYGKTLPVRNTYIRPISIGIFSACYWDGRKNEQWLINFCKNNEDAKLVNFVFVGEGWGKVVEQLSEIGCSFEWHNVSRSLPFEYQFQQNKLSSLNYYIYMGMDGGAMGTYDAYAQDVPLCVTYDGFHKGIPDLDFSFDDEKTFGDQMSKVVAKHARRINFFNDNNPTEYVKWLIDVWNGKEPEPISKKDMECISFNTVVEKKRVQYYKLNYDRVKSHIIKQVRKYIFMKRFR